MPEASLKPTLSKKSELDGWSNDMPTYFSLLNHFCVHLLVTKCVHIFHHFGLRGFLPEVSFTPARLLCLSSFIEL